MTSQPSATLPAAPETLPDPGTGSGTGSKVLSVRIKADLFDRLAEHAAKRGMSVQDYVTRTLIREDFDARFTAAVEETERFYGAVRP